MRAYIRKLQSKPETVRKQIFAGAMIFSMVFVGIVWVNSMGYILFASPELTKQEEIVKPFALFKQTISETVDNISASVGNVSSIIKTDDAKTQTPTTKTFPDATTKTMNEEEKSDDNLEIERVIDLIPS